MKGIEGLVMKNINNPLINYFFSDVLSEKSTTVNAMIKYNFSYKNSIWIQNKYYPRKSKCFFRYKIIT